MICGGNYTLTYEIRDANTAEILEGGSKTGEHIYYHQWGRKDGGDESAISEEMNKIIENEDGKIESNEIIINKAIEQLAKSLAREIIVYAKK